MPTLFPPCGQPCLSTDEINAAIRGLMSQPATRERAEQYQQLLQLWANACPQERNCWTTAA